ncbi:hypothetical protein [Kineococcus sp. SYSU DK002]|uniref:hypothetical protein n=1 Tax=Kineococcus sp. SYSU DK002 TaxID=3383123 RepID=UPI003D7ECD6D
MSIPKRVQRSSGFQYRSYRSRSAGRRVAGLPPEGPWSTEPDEVRWIDARTDLACVVSRNYWGAWCGYVAVTSSHPFCGRERSTINGIVVHGDLTYSGFSGPWDERAKGDGAPVLASSGYWLGFDCMHIYDGDLIPSRLSAPGAPAVDRNAVYRDLTFAIREVESLAQQLADQTAP